MHLWMSLERCRQAAALRRHHRILQLEKAVFLAVLSARQTGLRRATANERERRGLSPRAREQGIRAGRVRMMKAVSVVVPARNEEKLLPRCLFALRQQKYDDFEIIVVDSASTDHTQQVARSFGARVVR